MESRDNKPIYPSVVEAESEHLLDNYVFDYYVDNSKTIDELHNQLRIIIQDIMNKYTVMSDKRLHIDTIAICDDTANGESEQKSSAERMREYAIGGTL
jgi:hypothetical protein